MVNPKDGIPVNITIHESESGMTVSEQRMTRAELELAHYLLLRQRVRDFAKRGYPIVAIVARLRLPESTVRRMLR